MSADKGEAGTKPSTKNVMHGVEHVDERSAEPRQTANRNI